MGVTSNPGRNELPIRHYSLAGALATGMNPLKDADATAERANWVILFAYY